MPATNVIPMKPFAQALIGVRGCSRCGDPLQTHVERTSTLCTDCVQRQTTGYDEQLFLRQLTEMRQEALLRASNSQIHERVADALNPDLDDAFAGMAIDRAYWLARVDARAAFRYHALGRALAALCGVGR